MTRKIAKTMIADLQTLTDYPFHLRSFVYAEKKYSHSEPGGFYWVVFRGERTTMSDTFSLEGHLT